MRIAQVAPLYEAVQPRLYGGTERIVAHLTDALVELGHEVTLFASAEARTRATLVPVRDQAIRLDPSTLKSDLAAHLSMLHELHNRRDEFDVLHFHVDLVHFPFFEQIAAQTVTTLHGRLDLKDLPEAYARWPDYPLVSISDDQRAPMPEANWLATIPHGLAESIYTFNAAPRQPPYLAFLDRSAVRQVAHDEKLLAIVRRCRCQDDHVFVGAGHRSLLSLPMRNGGAWLLSLDIMDGSWERGDLRELTLLRALAQQLKHREFCRRAPGRPRRGRFQDAWQSLTARAVPHPVAGATRPDRSRAYAPCRRPGPWQPGCPRAGARGGDWSRTRRRHPACPGMPCRRRCRCRSAARWP